MKRTSEEAFEAMLESISRLDAGPVEILEALKVGFQKLTKPYLGLSHDLETLTDSIVYIKTLLSEPQSIERLRYERFEDSH
jgi:hypothetical protein